MSWQRPENINKLLSTYQNYSCVTEIILWNNNPQFYVSDLNLSKVKTINCSNDFGLNTRFASSLLASNRCVIVNDDDILLSEKNIINLIHHFEKDYTRIYSYEGRIYQNNQYSATPGFGRIENVKEQTEVDMCLTRATCFDKLYAAEYCKLSDVIFYDVNTNLNGEDIVFSHITTHLSGKKPLVLPIPDQEGYTELPAEIDTKISTREGFISRRNVLINRCKILLLSPNYSKENKNKTVIFGDNFYPYAYYQDSICVNSAYKKLIAKDDMNGIKYLSCETDPSYPWTIFYIDTKIPISNNDKLILKTLYNNHKVPTQLQLSFINNNQETHSQRFSINTSIDFVCSNEIPINKILNCSDDCLLTSIKFILHTNKAPLCELCITELSVLHQ